MRYKATIDIYLGLPDGEQVSGDACPLGHESQSASELADGVSETMRNVIHDSEGFFVDWSYATRDDGSFAYPTTFEGQTPEEEFQESQ